MTRLILIRHGKTHWNDPENWKMQGSADIELDDTGKEQAKLVARRLRRWKIDVVYSSRLKRAYATAEEIAKEHGLKVKRSKEFNEMDFGIFEGKRKSYIIKNLTKHWEKRHEDPYDYKGHKGESYRELEKRVFAKLKKVIKEHHGKSIVIVAHGAVLHTLIVKLLGKHIKDRREYSTKNTGINIFMVTKEGKFMKERLNDHKHLR